MLRPRFILLSVVTSFLMITLGQAAVGRGQDSSSPRTRTQISRQETGSTQSAGTSAQAQDEQPDNEDNADETPPTIEEKTKSFTKHDGYFPFYWDERQGKVWLEVPRFEEEFLYVRSLATGLGSNPVGLDRGQLGGEHVVRFERVGPKVLMVQRNLRYRAMSDNPLEQRAVRESFAESILWGAKIEAESESSVLVDATAFLLRDAHGVIGTLRSSGQGDFSLDGDRSAMYLPRTRNFPNNTEFEVTLTFASRSPGRYVRQTAPTPEAVTLRQHQSFIKLPDDGYTPRKFDPRNSSFPVVFADYAAPIDQPLEQRWISRHRLKKQNPNAATSNPIEPIVYYVDPGAPQPVRQALIEGASWWNDAFQAAGFRNAFQVRVLPEDADPMDVRYNVIQWVHRSTRGWSYGGSVTDPRTGEIIKGHVTLGSLRVRQDRTIFEGLNGAPTAASLLNGGLPNSWRADANIRHGRAMCCGLGGIPEEASLADLDPNLSPVEVALARIRQLSAHEVGHTLGFAHNYAASTYADRASVMDYPAPRVKIAVDDTFDLSDAYGVGIGEWDKFSVKYAYAQFPDGADEDAALDQLMRTAIDQGLLYISDADARPAGAAHPQASLWDEGTDPIASLRHEMRVRRIALDRFDATNLSAGEALAELELTLVPLYLHHRYQVDATAKLLGGVEYTYAVNGDGQTPMAAVPSKRQREALAALLVTLQSGELAIPQKVLNAIPPSPYRSVNDEERFPGQRGLIFDPMAAARVAAEMTIGNLLQPERATRLAAQTTDASESQDAGRQLDLHEVIETLINATWDGKSPEDASEAAVARVVRDAVKRELMSLATAGNASLEARAEAEAGLERVAALANVMAAARGNGTSALDKRYASMTIRDVERFLTRPHETASPPAGMSAPPGSPIGGR